MMPQHFSILLTRTSVLFVICFVFGKVNAQDGVNFWDKVRFGGNLGAAFGSGYTDVVVAPGAIYQFNQYAAFGVGLQGSYVHQRIITTPLCMAGLRLGCSTLYPKFSSLLN